MMDETLILIWTLISHLFYYIVLALGSIGAYLTNSKLNRLRNEHQATHQDYNDLDCAFCSYHREVILTTRLHSQPFGNDEVDSAWR